MTKPVKLGITRFSMQRIERLHPKYHRIRDESCRVCWLIWRRWEKVMGHA